MSIAVTFWHDPPLGPDERGYCYRDRGHFNKSMYRVAQRLISQHGAPIDRCSIWIIALLVAVLVIWWGLDFRRKRREMNARRHTVICSICGVIYEDKSDHALSKCPECESMNERSKVRDI